MSQKTVRIRNTHGSDSQPDAYGVPESIVEDTLDWYEKLGREAREKGESMQDMTENWHVVICFFDDKETEVGFGKIGTDDTLEGIVFTSLENARGKIE